MGILIYAESENGKYKKDSFEIASYARVTANKLNTSVTAVSINADDPSELGNYGVDKVLHISNNSLKNFNAAIYADIIKNNGSYEASFSEIDTNDSIHAIVQQYTSKIEETIRKKPEQYFWFHKRWKSVRKY